jgi:nitrite reductase/ring-hydroxylating ferredoxin subunit
MMTPTGIARAELEAKGRKLLRKDAKQILFIASAGRIFAVANRCPHEGYPLSEGTCGPGAVLTCNWHNWKFDLESGNALIGRDPVRTYAIEERNGEIFVDLSDPPAERLRARALAGLDAALADGDAARMAREVARLEKAGFSAKLAIVHAFARRNDRLEDGMTHAYGAAADWLALAERAPDDASRLAATLEPLGHLAWDTSGADAFPYAEGVAAWDEPAFLAAIESEDEPAAIAFVRGALAERRSYAELRPAFAAAALAHYADFGHCAIYTLKIGQLVGRLGEDILEPVLLAFTRLLVRATREEKLPEFRGYAPALAQWNGHGTQAVQADDLIGLSVNAILERVLRSSGRPVQELYDALLGAAAWNLLHFDVAAEYATANAIADNISWLDFTHALTFANACRHLCSESPVLWPRALLQMALFVGRNRKYVMVQADAEAWQVNDSAAFLAHEMAKLYDHVRVEPIVACHPLKMLFALEDELAASPDAPWSGSLCAAVNRYLNTPMKRHHGLRTANQAIEFIALEG